MSNPLVGPPHGPPRRPGGADDSGLFGVPVTLRPSPALLTYYFLFSLLFNVGFLIALIPLYFRYRTLQYVVEDEGITMRWGILFRREVSLTYARIQDIHLSSNFVERWLGLAKVQVQTASGSAGAEMTIAGLPRYEELRDFLYARMRGARDPGAARVPASGSVAELAAPGVEELAGILREIASEVRALRSALPGREVDDV
ncbi:MAG TPA: PH domain-containing protein [Longimicrobium sp.]|nr:PH domain-containing protein [Longimicrobium sp.]